MKPLVVIPTYNEADNVGAAVAAVLRVVPAAHVLVVDDASPDGTGRIVDGLCADDRRVHVLHRPGKGGLGRAYVDGFAWALAPDRDYDRILEMDADGSHDAARIPALLDASAAADVVLGSRYVTGGGTAGWSVWREAVSRGGSLYARAILGLPFKDLTGGFKCFRRSALEALDLSTVRSEGYAFQIELTWRAARRGLRIAEVPIVFAERRAGRSKMNRAIFAEAVVGVWGMRLRG